MHTFLFIADVSDALILPTLQRAGELLKANLPTVGNVPLTQHVCTLPEIGGGWLTLQPQGETNGVIHQLLEVDVAALVFGRFASDSSIATICDAWRRGGGDAVKCVAGSYGGVVVDRRNASVTLVSDWLGQSTLYYIATDDGFVVSPHDIALLASGLVPRRLDLITAASISATDSSLSGRSLLSGVEAMQPWQQIRYHRRRVEQRQIQVCVLTDRIMPRQHRECAVCLEQMVETMRRDAARLANQPLPIRLDITAGLDSRAVLALAHDARCPITTVTRGQPSSRDVRVGQHLAACCNYRHETMHFPEVVTDEILARLRLIAFSMNGDVAFRQALKPWEFPPAYVKAAGGGGEIFRGYCYPAGMASAAGTTWALRHLQQQLRSRMEVLPWSTPEIVDAVAGRLEALVDDLARLSPQPHDILDLFYLYQRFRIWGAKGVRFTWRRSWRPFTNPELIRLAYRFPPPIGRYALIHKEIIRCLFPRAYYWPLINGRDWLPLYGRGTLRSTVRHLIKRSTTFISHHLGNRQATARNNPVFRVLADCARQGFWDRVGIGQELFGQEGLRHLVETRATALEYLVPLETWWELAGEIEQQARTNHK